MRDTPYRVLVTDTGAFAVQREDQTVPIAECVALHDAQTTARKLNAAYQDREDDAQAREMVAAGLY